MGIGMCAAIMARADPLAGVAAKVSTQSAPAMCRALRGCRTVAIRVWTVFAALLFQQRLYLSYIIYLNHGQALQQRVGPIRIPPWRHQQKIPLVLKRMWRALQGLPCYD